MSGLIGVIGGSGLYEIEGIQGLRFEKIDTPFGCPSDEYAIGTFSGKDVAFLPRHGRGHVILPGEINFRANIYGFKKLGVEWIISLSAVGSLKEELKPMDMVIVDQFLDRTKGRINTFFGDGIAAHVGFADPICKELASVLYEAAKEADVTVHRGGTYVNIEGPAFSTRAESNVYRKLGMDVLGMTNVVEAKLAREAEICYATVAMVTDYDCWHEGHDSVSVDMVLAALLSNAENAKKIIKNSLPKISKERKCSCKDALSTALITARDKMPDVTKKKLDIIIGKYI
ncbi:MAG TPA: S-methyl-5'-thioadenosine phosphorylase [Candidatus Eremiobacteraeota bacterium]|nr:MAG: S-methyl-5'-thioadenosine phosphorylase [bacterium ADurb.Bin363]HPZ09453.1 S-methyl-5'-thioadenosine phosphorylase [Candidatus Eremiobacteraeota bacterium]